MRRLILALPLCCVAAFLVSGCSRPGVPAPQGNATGESPTATTDTANTEAAVGEQPSSDVKLEILSFDEIQQRLAAQQGKVVVMDMWSTSCPPCMKDFHNLVDLHKTYGGEDVACVSMSFDYEGLGTPEESQPPVLEFLKSQGAAFDNFMSNEESDVLYRKFQLNSVPAVFVYDRTGKLRERFESEGAYEKVRALVAELVKEPVAASETPAEAPAE
jgi:thiol-disulfide isomerase/thioredoxin